MSNLGSLFLYIITFITSALSIFEVGHIYRNKEKFKYSRLKIVLLTIIGLAIPITIASLRYNVGTDYDTYFSMANNLGKNTILENISSENIELLFWIIIRIVGIMENPQMLFFIMAFLTIVIMYLALLNYKEKLSLGFMFFLYLFLYFTNSFNIIRQALAVVIVVYSYKFIINRNLKKFLLTIVIATLFHTTAILFLPMYFIINISKKRKVFVKFIFALMLILVILNYETIINFISGIPGFGRFEGYTTHIESKNRETIVNVLMLGIILIFRKILIKYDKINEDFIYFYLLACIISLTGYISPYAKRFAIYFEPAIIFILASLPKITKTKEQKILVYFLISVYAIGMFIITTYVLGQGEIIPYQTIFTNK